MEKTVKQRLIEYLSLKGIGQNKFEKMAGISNGYISNLKDAPREKILTKILQAAPGLSRVWLLTGEGGMLVSSYGPNELSGSSRTIKGNQPSGRPYYDIDFLGGFDMMVNDQTTTPAYFIDFAPFNKDGIYWCNITGHSMEPKIEHGDIIALKEVHDIRGVEFGEIYAIVTDYDLRTVKIVRRGDDEDHLRLVPINKDFDPIDVEVDTILRIYKVVCNIKKF